MAIKIVNELCIVQSSFLLVKEIFLLWKYDTVNENVLLKKFIRVVSGKGMEELGNYGDIDKIKNTLLCSRVFYLKSWCGSTRPIYKKNTK